MGFGGAWRLDPPGLAQRARLGCRLLALAGVAVALEPFVTRGQIPGLAGAALALGVGVVAGVLALAERRRACRRGAARAQLVIDAAGMAWLHEPLAAPCAVEPQAFLRRRAGAWLSLAGPSHRVEALVSGCPSGRDDGTMAALSAWLVWLRRSGAR